MGSPTIRSDPERLCRSDGQRGRCVCARVCAALGVPLDRRLFQAAVHGLPTIRSPVPAHSVWAGASPVSAQMRRGVSPVPGQMRRGVSPVPVQMRRGALFTACSPIGHDDAPWSALMSAGARMPCAHGTLAGRAPMQQLGCEFRQQALAGGAAKESKSATPTKRGTHAASIALHAGRWGVALMTAMTSKSLFGSQCSCGANRTSKYRTPARRRPGVPAGYPSSTTRVPSEYSSETPRSTAHLPSAEHQRHPDGPHASTRMQPLRAVWPIIEQGQSSQLACGRAHSRR